MPTAHTHLQYSNTCMAYTLSSHTARSVPSLTAHHHLEACARTVPEVRALRVRIAAATQTHPAFTPFARGRGGSVESTASLSGGAAVEDRHGAILGVRAVAWVVHLLGLVVARESDDPHELTCLRVPVEVEVDRVLAVDGLAVDADVDVGSIGAARPAKQTCICGQRARYRSSSNGPTVTSIMDLALRMYYVLCKDVARWPWGGK